MGTVPRAQGSRLPSSSKGWLKQRGSEQRGQGPAGWDAWLLPLMSMAASFPSTAGKSSALGAPHFRAAPPLPIWGYSEKASQNAQGYNQALNLSSPCPPTLAGNPESAELSPQTKAPFTPSCPASCLFPRCPSCMVGGLGCVQGI